jgi:hypothetical protein
MSRLSVTAVLSLLAAGFCLGNPQANSETVAPPTTGATFSSSDGTSPQSAVVIQGPQNEFAGVKAEYEWIRQHYPGSTRQGQSLVSQEGHLFDVIRITTNDGREMRIYFDVSSFFGKY